MSAVAAASRDRVGAFVRTELGWDPGRLRAFLRVEGGLVIASFVVITFKPTNGYWTIAYLILVSVPTVGSSARNAVARFNASVIGCAVAVLLIVAAFDEAWLYVPLQALVVGVALFAARSTPIGPVALTGGATFAIISGSDVAQPPELLVTLGFYRILQAVIGGGIGAFAQLCLWPDDPLTQLRRSLTAQLAEVEARLRGEPVALDAACVGRNFELLNNAIERHSGLVGCRSEVTAEILEVARIVDETLHHERRHGAGVPAPAIVDEARATLRRVQRQALFQAPPPPPPAPRPPWRITLQETMKPARRAAIKTALSAFIATILTQLIGFPAAGALFTALAVSMQTSSGTDISKSLIVVAGMALALAVVMLVVAPSMPSLEDPGSFLVMAALAFAPTAWLTVGGPRVRNAGLFGTVVVATAAFEGFRPNIDLELPTRFAVTIAIGALVVGAVDRVVWPVDARRAMLQRAALLLREAARLYREPDPRVVLSPNRSARWRLHRHIVALVQLRWERAPLPGTPWFEPEEEALRVAASAQRLVVARIEQARRELEHPAPDASLERAAVAARLDKEAVDLEVRYGLVPAAG